MMNFNLPVQFSCHGCDRSAVFNGIVVGEVAENTKTGESISISETSGTLLEHAALGASHRILSTMVTGKRFVKNSRTRAYYEIGQVTIDGVSARMGIKENLWTVLAIEMTMREPKRSRRWASERR